MSDTGSGIITEASTGHFIEAGGTTIHYHDVGSGEPMLILPFWGPQPGVTAWLALHKALPILSQHYRCIAMDLPNYGLTGPIVYNEPVHDVIARTAISLLDSLDIGQFHAVGTSVGATTCLVTSLTYPGRVRKLVIGSCHTSTGGDPYLLAPFPSEASRALRDFNADDQDDFKLRKVIRCTIHDESLITDELIDSIHAVRSAHPDHAAASRASYSVPHSNLGEIDKVDIPTLIIHGRFDRMVPVEQGLMLLNYISTSDLAVFNNCGHWPSFEQPDEWTSQILRFLQTT